MADTFTAWNSTTHPIVKLEDDWNNLLAHGLMKPYTYMFYTDGSYYYAFNGDTGTLVYGGANNTGGTSGTSCHTVLNAAIQAAGQGGKIFVKAGDYTLTDSVVDNVGVTIEGEHGAGDFYFVDDSVYGGYADKNGVTFIDGDAAGIDMFKLGYKVVGGTNSLTFGCRLKNICFTAYSTPPAPADYTNYKSSSAVRCHNIQSPKFENLCMYHKEYGMHITSDNAGVPLRYSDMIYADNLHFGYNVYGLYYNGAGGDHTFNNILGYINQKCLIYATPHYNTVFNRVVSIADGREGTGDWESPIVLFPQYGDLYLNNVIVQGYNNVLGGNNAYHGIYVAPSGLAETCKIFITRPLIQGVRFNAIHVDSAGSDTDTAVFIRDIYVGDLSGKSVMSGGGAEGEVEWYVVCNVDPTKTTVYVDGGYADSELVTVHDWFINCTSVKNVMHYNPLAANSGYALFNDVLATMGYGWPPGAGGTTPTASTAYTVVTSNYYVTSSDSGNADCAIIIKDSGGNTLLGPVSTLSAQYVPVGYTIDWGAFTGAAPTVTIYGV